MKQEKLIYVHPAITWQNVGDDKLQIRVPDGQHITLTESSSVASSMLEQLNSPQSYPEIVDWANSQQIGQEALEATLATLHEYSIVVESESKNNAGVFGNVLDFNVNSSESIRSGLPYPYFSDFDVVGEGYIHDCIEETAKQLKESLLAIKNGEKSNPLRVVCTDTGDQVFLTQQNQKAIDDQVAFLPVQWTDEFLAIGPLYIPNESACYECLNIRKRAASNFLSELDGVLSKQVNRSVEVKVDPTLEHLVSYAVGRYLSLVSCGMFHLIKPNEMETWDILKAERTVGEVLRVPRCDACGRKKSTDPIRAIRDLNS